MCIAYVVMLTALGESWALRIIFGAEGTHERGTVIKSSQEGPLGSEKSGWSYSSRHVQMPSLEEGRNCLASGRQLSTQRGSSQTRKPWGQGWIKTVIGLQPSMLGVRSYASPKQESENLGNKNRGQCGTESLGFRVYLSHLLSFSDPLPSSHLCGYAGPKDWC